MKLKDIANFHEFTACQIKLGGSEVDFIWSGGSGLQQRQNYNRYLSLNQLSALPSSNDVLNQASTFKLQQERETQVLDLAEFEEKRKRFHQRVKD